MEKVRAIPIKKNPRMLTMALVVLIIVASCKPNTFDSEPQLWAHIKNVENGYHHQKVVGNVVYTLTYRPTDILVKQELGEKFTEHEVDSLRNKYGNYLYFNLSMSANNQELLTSKAGDRSAFGAMVNQLAFGMAEKVHLISQTRDTVSMADYSYPRMYGMSNSTNMLLVYPKDSELLGGDFFHFTVEDLGFSTGEVGFKIPTKSLTNEPKLNFKNTL